MRHTLLTLLAAVVLCIAAPRLQAQTLPGKLPASPAKATPWKPADLLEPAALAQNLADKNPKNDPLILNIGFVNNIKGAVKVGPASTEEGLADIKTYLKQVPKNRQVVIYCGCCPFDKCPNVRPAFSLLKAEGYKNMKLLNLKDNLKTNWIGNGYPMAE